MDSLKKLKGIPLNDSEGLKKSSDDEKGSRPKKKSKKKKKRDKKKKNSTQTEDQTDPFNPMEQVQNALRRRNEVLSRRQTLLGLNPNTSCHNETGTQALMSTVSTTHSANIQISGEVSLPSSVELESAGWEMAIDPTTKKPYYFSRSTGERTWENPLCAGNDKTDDKLSLLPDGWSKAIDANSGKEYYYHTKSKRTSWDPPTS